MDATKLLLVAYCRGPQAHLRLAIRHTPDCMVAECSPTSVWHRPRGGVDLTAYEDAQRAFHSSLETSSASFRITELPFGDGGDGYEDWYLVEDWEGLGELNRVAVDPARLPAHDQAAAQSADGWGGVYSLVRGPASISDGADWLHKPRGESSASFIASLPEATIWQRQMVLGPGPEFCAATPASDGRERIWPKDR